VGEAENAEVIRRYFDGCQSGDLEVLLSTLAPDVLHYFIDRPSVSGAEHLARYWRKMKRVTDPIWTVDHIIVRGDEVVSEWSVVQTPPGTQRRVLNRGSEWYVMREGRIAEVRAYFRWDDQANSELVGFPYRERGYFTSPR
jgi:ketosteroid isomerase-like protein